MSQYHLSPFQVRLNEAKQRARTETKLARRTVPGAIWPPALTPVTTRKLVSSPMPVETAPKIKDEVTPARPILDVPKVPSPAISLPHNNPYAALTAGKKRKRPLRLPSPPAKLEEMLFVSQDEDDADVDQPGTYIDVEDPSPSGNRTSKSKAVASSNGTQRKAKLEPRPFAPLKKPATKKTAHHSS